MSLGWDFEAIALIAAVALLFGWFFWHTAVSMIYSARRIAEIVDGSSARQRSALEHEAKYGPRPLWYRAAQKLTIAVLIVGSAWLVWDRLMG